MIALVVIAAWVLGAGQGSSVFGQDVKLGVVEVNGPIMESAEIINALATLENDPSVKAVVLRIDSPGGAVGASQEIYRSVRNMSKPVVASMGNMAASGGYYIAAACDEIVCNPGTITGSIGVITTLPNLESLLDKLGIKFQTLSSGPLKGAGQSDRALNNQEKAMFEGLIKDLHAQFVSDVALGRDMEFDEVMALADGRIYSGRQALDNGLADMLGDYQDALRLAANKAGLPQVPDIIIRPQDKDDFWQMLGSQGARAAQAVLKDMLLFVYNNSLPRFIMPQPGE